MMQGEGKWRAIGVAFILILAAVLLGACQVHYAGAARNYGGSQAYDYRQSYVPYQGYRYRSGYDRQRYVYHYGHRYRRAHRRFRH